jgi:prophage regulatory protein
MHLTDQCIRLREVERLTGLSKSTIYRLEALGSFPSRVKLSERASGWKSNEVTSWLANRPRASATRSAA